MDGKIFKYIIHSGVGSIRVMQPCCSTRKSRLGFCFGFGFLSRGLKDLHPPSWYFDSAPDSNANNSFISKDVAALVKGSISRLHLKVSFAAVCSWYGSTASWGTDVIGFSALSRKKITWRAITNQEWKTLGPLLKRERPYLINLGDRHRRNKIAFGVVLPFPQTEWLFKSAGYFLDPMVLVTGVHWGW